MRRRSFGRRIRRDDRRDRRVSRLGQQRVSLLDGDPEGRARLPRRRRTDGRAPIDELGMQLPQRSEHGRGRSRVHRLRTVQVGGGRDRSRQRLRLEVDGSPLALLRERTPGRLGPRSIPESRALGRYDRGRTPRLVTRLCPGHVDDGPGGACRSAARIVVGEVVAPDGAGTGYLAAFKLRVTQVVRGPAVGSEAIEIVGLRSGLPLIICADSVMTLLPGDIVAIAFRCTRARRIDPDQHPGVPAPSRRLDHAKRRGHRPARASSALGRDRWRLAGSRRRVRRGGRGSARRRVDRPDGPTVCRQSPAAIALMRS